jgi:hypothetical protein
MDRIEKMKRRMMGIDIETMSKKEWEMIYGGPPMAPDPRRFLPTELSIEERKRLEFLEEERRQQNKFLRLQKFKELSGDLRQSILDSLVMREQINNINTTHAEMSQEELSLREKEYKHQKAQCSSWMMDFGNTPSDDDLLTVHSTPFNIELNNTWSGITLDDLKQAHLDATMDETVLKP